MAVGPFRPAILLPNKLFAAMTQTDVDQIGLHEATHLARRDDYTLFLQRIVEAVFALHPVVRWITRQLDLEREIACDDVVARSGDTARAYADCLTRMVAACGGVRPSLAAANVADSRSHLSRRVELLLRARRNMSPRLRQCPFALIAIALLCAAAVLAKAPLLIAFAVPQTPISVAAQPRTELPSTPPLQAPVAIAQTTKPVPPPPPPLAPPTPPPPAPRLPLHILGPNDVIGVTVFNDDTVPGTYAIGPDGRMSMPLIGNFSAAGLTIPELQSVITRKLDPYIVNPVVNVQLLRNNSRKYTVIGAVMRPGPYPLLKETTILDALSASGGFREFADRRNIILRRGTEDHRFNYEEAVLGIVPEQNIIIEDGDIIVVRE
jgi:polysaccharide export outer membrane protein